MRQNLIQGASLREDGRLYIDGDWYPLGVPGNIELGEGAYLDSSYTFSAFHSQRPIGFRLGRACGIYERANFICGPDGQITVGDFTMLNSTTLFCQSEINIGAHCMLAWGSVITDTWGAGAPVLRDARRRALESAALDPDRQFPCLPASAPVILEDNVWIGFDAVVLPGVRLGRGCIVGSKSIVEEDIPPYAVVVGNPARIVRFLDTDDTDEARQKALQQYLAP